MTVLQRLESLADSGYREFSAKLIPNVNISSIIGVRTPELKALAKELYGTKEAETFLKKLPHKYFEENQLHAFLINREKSFEKCLGLLEKFLPYIDNWATCDQLAAPALAKNPAELEKHIYRWIDSGETYTVRYGAGALMRFYLDKNFRPEYPEKVASVKSDEYYVNMMLAWYFATALAKRWEECIGYIENKKLPVRVHNKAIQKSVESNRIPPERKEYLKTLKIR